MKMQWYKSSLLVFLLHLIIFTNTMAVNVFRVCGVFLYFTVYIITTNQYCAVMQNVN